MANTQAHVSCTALWLCLGLMGAPLAWAQAAYRTTSVAPSVYRQVFSPSQARWGGDNPLKQGTRLNPEDRLISRGSGMATILCDSGSFLFKKRNYTQVSSFCQAQRAAPIQALPGIQDPATPYLVEPRATLVRGPEVLVRWNPVAGAHHYQVWLLRQRDRRLLWGTQVSGVSHTVLPRAVGLVSGETYRLVIEADTGSSSQLEASSASLGFGILSPTEAVRLTADLQDIHSLDSEQAPAQARALLEAGALEQHALIAEAMTVLTKQEDQAESLEGQLQLGRLSSLQGLNRRAIHHFQRAIALANVNADQEAKGLANAAIILSERLAACAASQPQTGPASSCHLSSPP